MSDIGHTGGGSIRVMHPLFQAGQGGSTPTSPLQFRFDPIDLKRAVELNRIWHSRLPRIDSHVAGWICYGADFEGRYYAVAIWGLPVARLLPQDGTVFELRRLAIAPDAPKNTASRMLGWMARDLAGRNPGLTKLVSYQDTEAHTGGIYKASGWRPVDTTGSTTTWDMPGRSRPQAQSSSPKVRWEKVVGDGPTLGPSPTPKAPEPLPGQLSLFT